MSLSVGIIRKYLRFECPYRGLSTDHIVIGPSTPIDEIEERIALEIRTTNDKRKAAFLSSLRDTLTNEELLEAFLVPHMIKCKHCRNGVGTEFVRQRRVLSARAALPTANGTISRPSAERVANVQRAANLNVPQRSSTSSSVSSFVYSKQAQHCIGNCLY